MSTSTVLQVVQLRECVWSCPVAAPFWSVVSDTITVFETADQNGAATGQDHTHSRNWTTWSAVLVDIQPDRHRPGGPAGDHGSGLANYLFADSHAAALPTAPLKARIAAGDNFAKPPE